MSGLIESASAILSASERRLEVIAQNTANMSTPGYQRLISFQSLLTQPQDTLPSPQISTMPDSRVGSLTPTGNPFDLALAGAGTFLVREGDQFVTSRGGSFRRTEDGNLVDGLGRALQQSGGGDLVVETGSPTIGSDGVIVIEGQAVARIGVFASASSSQSDSIAPANLDDVNDPQVRQGMVEQSNVMIGDEMVSMMAISRSAEGGARLVQTYDELIGKVFAAFGQSGR